MARSGYTRRRVLAAAGAGTLAGIAGCLGDGLPGGLEGVGGIVGGDSREALLSETVVGAATNSWEIELEEGDVIDVELGFPRDELESTATVSLTDLERSAADGRLQFEAYSATPADQQDLGRTHTTQSSGTYRVTLDSTGVVSLAVFRS